MSHGWAEPNVILFDDLLNGSGFGGDGGTGGVLAAASGDVLPIPNTTEDAVGLGEMDGGEDKLRFLALLPNDPRNEGGGFMHEEFLTEPVAGVVEAPEAWVGGEAVGVDDVHDVHRGILVRCSCFEGRVKMSAGHFWIAARKF